MYYTQEQIDRANQADLVSFLQSQGEQITRAGRSATRALQAILADRYEVLDVPPVQGKDYNDMLCMQLGLGKKEGKELGAREII